MNNKKKKHQPKKEEKKKKRKPNLRAASRSVGCQKIPAWLQNVFEKEHKSVTGHTQFGTRFASDPVPAAGGSSQSTGLDWAQFDPAVLGHLRAVRPPRGTRAAPSPSRDFPSLGAHDSQPGWEGVLPPPSREHGAEGRGSAVGELEPSFLEGVFRNNSRVFAFAYKSLRPSVPTESSRGHPSSTGIPPGT